MMNAFLRKLSWFARRRRKESELRDELEFHLAEEAEERREAGLSEEQARSAARRDLGNIALVVEDTRAVWGWGQLEQAGQDLRYAVRTLSRTPSVTLAAVITLALGIGLTTAIFSVVYGVLLRPLPFNEPERLVVLHTIRQHGDRYDNAVSPPNFMSLMEEQSHAFANLTGAVDTARTLTGIGEARRVDGVRVSAGFFEMLDVSPVLGRTFDRDENEPGREGVVVISHALWQQQFGADPAVIGRAIVLDAIAHTVIGVMPPGFDFPGGRAFWVPQAYGRNYFSAASTAGRRGTAVVRVIGRLGSEVSLEAAQAELDARARRLEERFPETNAGVSFTAIPLHEELVGDVRTPLLMLLGAVGFVLLIAASNVAGLLLARGASRCEEIALRSALGAGRARIVRQLVTESLLLGVGGGVLGLLLAFWTTNALVAAQAEGLRQGGLSDAIRLDGTVLAFAVGVTVLAGLLAGLVPAFRAAADGLAGTLQTAGRSGLASHRGQRLRSALVVGQLALAVVLLHGAGLLLHSFVRLTSVDPGFRTEQVLSFRVELPSAAYGGNERVQTFFSEFLGGIRRHTGVLSVGAIHHLPIGSGGRFLSRFRVEGRTPEGEEPAIGVRIVTPEYFQAMGMPVVRGRSIDDRDRADRFPTVVINEMAAAQFFAGEDPLGRRLTNFGYDPIEQASDAFTVVGIVANVRSRGLSEAPLAEAYFAHAQVPLRQMFVVARAAGDPLAQIGAIRSEIRALDPNLPIPEFRTLDQVVADSLDRPRFFATLLSLFSAVALTLAAVGIFGLVSFAVARRTREIGVRIALGASPRMLLGTIVRDAFLLVAIGLGIGLGGALALTRMLESLLFEISPTDPVTLAGVAVTLGATALLASVAPAWRASTVDPLVTLRVG
jgi:predicted permease